MVVDAFIYMFFVGFGTSLGCLATVAIGYTLYNRKISKNKRKKGGLVIANAKKSQ